MKKPDFPFNSNQNVDDIIKFVKEKKPLNPVFVDCHWSCGNNLEA